MLSPTCTVVDYAMNMISLKILELLKVGITFEPFEYTNLCPSTTLHLDDANCFAVYCLSFAVCCLSLRNARAFISSGSAVHDRTPLVYPVILE